MLAGWGLIVPGELGHQPGGFIRLQIDLIVTGDTFVFFLESPDSLIDRVAVFGGAGFVQPLVDFIEFLLIFFLKTGIDTFILHRPLLRPAGEFDFPFVLAGLSLEMDLMASGGFDHAGFLHVNIAFSFAAHDEIVIFVQGEPFEVFLAGNPRVHDDQGAFRGMELFEHFLQGAAFANVALEDLRVPDKPLVHRLAALWYTDCPTSCVQS